MPNYEYACKNCEHVFEEMHSIAERELPLSEPCKECGGERYISLGATGIVDPMRAGITKVPEGFKDRLREIKKKFPGNKINIP